MSKFNIGDQVRVINYGSLIFITNYKKTDSDTVWEETEAGITCDLKPELIGQTGIITEAIGEENTAYSIHGIPDKKKGYADGQLELVYRPDYK